MIDYRIILQILHSHAQESSSPIEVAEKKEWARDKGLIFFPSQKKNFNVKINSLNAIQYLQRMRLLYTILLRSN